MDGSREPSITDLIIALKICSSKDWRDIGKTTIFEKIKISRIMYDISYQALVFKDFVSYITDSMSAPKLWQNDKQKEQNISNKSSMPVSLVMATILMSKIGFSEEEAWSMPVGRAVWYSTAYSYLEGADIETISTSEEERSQDDLEMLIKYTKEQEQKYKQKG
jgi:hypothetical protein